MEIIVFFLFFLPFSFLLYTSFGGFFCSVSFDSLTPKNLIAVDATFLFFFFSPFRLPLDATRLHYSRPYISTTQISPFYTYGICRSQNYVFYILYFYFLELHVSFSKENAAGSKLLGLLSVG